MLGTRLTPAPFWLGCDYVCHNLFLRAAQKPQGSAGKVEVCRLVLHVWTGQVPQHEAGVS